MSRESNMARSFVIVVAALFATGLGMACSELEARRDIQKADKLYEEGKYAEAITVYEDALKQSDIDIGHHNLAVAAFIAFQPGNTSPANQGYAKKASEHFQIYLKSHPNDAEIIELLTTVWLDSDQIDQALAFWKGVRDTDPTNPNALRQLGSIQRMAGNYEEAIRWDYLRVDEAKDDKKKVQILVGIGQLQYSRLSKKEDSNLKLIDGERLVVADIGVEALQKAITINPKNASAHSLLATIYQYRSFAHLNGWGKLVDISSQRYHASQRDSFSKKARAKSKAAAGASDKATTDKPETDKPETDKAASESSDSSGTLPQNEAKE
ncbi:MAG: hypothetical protein JKY56_02160 [Kofleriaceae bacterium]|nr:hypothetical protein [Kofleriaceae bacterium]